MLLKLKLHLIFNLRFNQTSSKLYTSNPSGRGLTRAPQQPKQPHFFN